MAGQSVGSRITRDETGLATNDENIASLFQPDSLLSAQYFDNLRRKILLEPEKSLMLAVLQDAVNNYQNNMMSQDKKGKRLFADAEDWIVQGGSDWIFSFENVCEALGFNPAYVRQGLLRWKEKNRQEQSRRGAWQRKRLAV
jgi:hypothetical protein